MSNGLRSALGLGFLVVFGAGLAVGLLAGRRSAEREPSTYLERLTEEYGLRPEQVAAIRALLDREQAEIASILERVEQAVHEDIRQARARTVALIREELAPEQRERFDRELAGSSN